MPDGSDFPRAGNPRGSGYPKVKNNWYVEPKAATRALLRAETFTGTVYDPACGCGNVLKECRKAGLDAYGSDLIDRGSGERGGINFLEMEIPERRPRHIITNPPFSLSLQFADKALTIATRKVAILNRLNWLTGQARSKALEEMPLVRVWIFRRRILMPPGHLRRQPPKSGGFIDYAWFLFDVRQAGQPFKPIVQYLDQ